MIHDILGAASGTQKLNAKGITQLFELYAALGHGSMEDPAEDVFVSLVYFRGFNYRIFEGLWEGNAFQLQRLLRAVETMPDENPFLNLKEQITGLLALSETVAARRSLARYSSGAEYPAPKLPEELSKRAAEFARAVSFTNQDIDELGVQRETLAAFSTSIRSHRERSQADAETALQWKPLLKHSAGVVLALPANVSTAIRLRIINFADQHGMTESLHKRLANEYGQLVEKTPILGMSFGAPLHWRSEGDLAVAQVLTEVDPGRFIHLLFVLDSFDEFREHGFESFSPTFADSAGGCQKHIERTVSQISSRPDFKEGITVVMGCGWGRGLAAPAFESGREDWRVEVTSIDQLVTLSWVKGMRPLHLFRLLDHIRELEHRNVHIQNVNGLANLYAFSASHGFHVAPHSAIDLEMVQGEGPLMLWLPLESIFGLRCEVAQLHDLHLAEPPRKKSVLVRRYHLTSYFPAEAKQPLYGSLDDAALGTLRSVYEGQWLKVWLTTQTSSSDDRDGFFRFWDAFTKWLGIIVPGIETAIGNQPPTTVEWHIEYEMSKDPADFPDRPVDDASELYALIQTEVDHSRFRLTTRVPIDVFVAFRQQSNVAEKAVLMSLAQGVADLLGVALDPRATVSKAVGSEHARQFHLFEAREFADFVADRIPRHPFRLEQFDDSLSRIGIASRVENAPPGSEITGINACTAILNRVVDSLWSDVRAMLRRFDRRKTIEKYMLNMLAAQRSTTQWQRTIRAVLALYGNEAETLRIASEQVFRNNIAHSTARNAIEMALCECPDTAGEDPGELELSRLMALIQLMVQYGGWSDGIQHEVIPAKMNVTALGLLEISSEFHDTVLEPYGFGMEADRLRGYAEAYDDLYQRAVAGGTVAEVAGAKFSEIWKEEFGFDIDEAWRFLDELENLAIRDQSPIVCWNQSRFIETAAKSMAEEAARRFIDELTIKHRAAWDRAPEGYSDKDIVPWRFRRRLSLVHRPIVQLTDAEDSPCLCTPEAVRMGLALRLSRTYGAVYDDQVFESQQMRAWIGERRNQLGHEFTESVADVLRKAGWECWIERQPPEILGRKLDRDYGDVDILACDRRSARTLVVECKNLFVAKTPGEIAKQIGEFRGKLDKNGRPDRLLRHLQRVALLREHPKDVARYVGLEETTIESVLVFRNRVPIEFIDDDAVRQVSIRYPETLSSI